MKLPPKPRRLVLAASCTLTLLLGACSNQELYTQLSERQANEMVALLRGAGIEAEKQSNDGRFSILTAPNDFPQAVRTLSAQGYPRESFDSMGKVFKREGFVSSPLEERARLMHAMSQEISNTIANIDGVVTARVHLVVPEHNPLLDKPQPAAAAVFIKHRPDKDLSGQVTQIKALVVNSIEGLSYDNVTVALFPAEDSAGGAAAGRRPAATATREAALYGPLLSGTAAGGFALAGGGLLWWRRRAVGQAAMAPTKAAPPALAGPTPGPTPGPAHELASNDFQATLRRAANRS